MPAARPRRKSPLPQSSRGFTNTLHGTPNGRWNTRAENSLAIHLRCRPSRTRLSEWSGSVAQVAESGKPGKRRRRAAGPAGPCRPSVRRRARPGRAIPDGTTTLPQTGTSLENPYREYGDRTILPCIGGCELASCPAVAGLSQSSGGICVAPWKPDNRIPARIDRDSYATEQRAGRQTRAASVRRASRGPSPRRRPPRPVPNRPSGPAGTAVVGGALGQATQGRAPAIASLKRIEAPYRSPKPIFGVYRGARRRFFRAATESLEDFPIPSVSLA